MFNFCDRFRGIACTVLLRGSRFYIFFHIEAVYIHILYCTVTTITLSLTPPALHVLLSGLEE